MVRRWVLDLEIDRGIYRVDLRRRTYQFVGPNPDWNLLSTEINARNKRQLHGLTRTLRDGTSRVFIDPTWHYTASRPCPECYSWIPRDSPCDHDKYECPTCGRRQCVLHWRYPMRSHREAVHFLKSAQVVTGKACFVRAVAKRRGSRESTMWKIFTSESDYQSYVDTGQHSR
ncbi:MAG TPA: hypothetical protein VFR23_10695 [Jiangellaceae bacterium]|nr:hypothetical protein [Jiangellaceae bacterium]